MSFEQRIDFFLLDIEFFFMDHWTGMLLTVMLILTLIISSMGGITVDSKFGSRTPCQIRLYGELDETGQTNSPHDLNDFLPLQAIRDSDGICQLTGFSREQFAFDYPWIKNEVGMWARLKQLVHMETGQVWTINNLSDSVAILLNSDQLNILEPLLVLNGRTGAIIQNNSGQEIESVPFVPYCSWRNPFEAGQTVYVSPRLEEELLQQGITGIPAWSKARITAVHREVIDVRFESGWIYTGMGWSWFFGSDDPASQVEPCRCGRGNLVTGQQYQLLIGLERPGQPDSEGQEVFLLRCHQDMVDVQFQDGQVMALNWRFIGK